MPLLAWIAGAAVAGTSWVGAQLRPAARARRRARRDVREVGRELGAVRKQIGRSETQVAARAGAYDRFARDERLKGVPVDDLKAFGADRVRWDVLEEAGLTDAASLHGVRRPDLERLDGIGATSADRILDAHAKLVTANEVEPVPLPGVDDTSAPTAELRRAAHGALVARDALGPFEAELERRHGGLTRRFDLVRRGTRLIQNLLGEKGAERKRVAFDETAAIRDEVAALATPGGLLERSATARKVLRKTLRQAVADDALRAEHEARVADFAAVIERALGRGRDGPSADVGGLPDEIAQRVEAFELSVPTLRATLRGYQEFGAKYLLVQRRTLLGDEMGLGKTMQALAVMTHLSSQEGKRLFLAVAPASIMYNWQRETRARTSLPVHVLHGPNRREHVAAWKAEGGLAVTSFTTLRLLVEDDPDALAPDLLVVDEAHYVKNPDAARTRAITSLAQRTPWVAYMTGTPIENRLSDFQNLVGQLQPDVAAGLGEREASDDLSIGRSTFLRAVAPVYLRRNQTDVLRELPPRIDKEEWVELAPEDREAYREAVGGKDIMAMRRAATIGAGGKGVVAGATSAKLDRLAELLAEYRETGTKVLLFSFFLDVLAVVEKRFQPVGRIAGDVPVDERMQAVDRFAAQEGHALLIAQIQAGGVGLNIQAASAVVLMEPQWKPSTEEQAVARAHRMGQARTVLVHRLLSRDSVDERMKVALEEKRELFDAFARESAVKSASREATETELVQRVIDEEYERLFEAETAQG